MASPPRKTFCQQVLHANSEWNMTLWKGIDIAFPCIMVWIYIGRKRQLWDVECRFYHEMHFCWLESNWIVISHWRSNFFHDWINASCQRFAVVSTGTHASNKEEDQRKRIFLRWPSYQKIRKKEFLFCCCSCCHRGSDDVSISFHLTNNEQWVVLVFIMVSQVTRRK